MKQKTIHLSMNQSYEAHKEKGLGSFPYVCFAQEIKAFINSMADETCFHLTEKTKFFVSSNGFYLFIYVVDGITENICRIDIML